MIAGKRGSQERFNWWANLVFWALIVVSAAVFVALALFGDFCPSGCCSHD